MLLHQRPQGIESLASQSSCTLTKAHHDHGLSACAPDVPRDGRGDRSRDFANQAIRSIDAHDGCHASSSADSDHHDRFMRLESEQSRDRGDEFAGSAQVNCHGVSVVPVAGESPANGPHLRTSALNAGWGRRSPRLADMDNDSARDSVDTAVAAAVARLALATAPSGENSGELLAPLARLASKGKRMRALLLLSAHAAAGGGREDAAVRVSAALEMFQVAALIHDDVLDDSDTRRGMPSTHRALESTHSTSAWRGDKARFGTNGAILAGDLALMSCMSELVSALVGVDAGVAAEVGERFSTMASVCTVGQYLDLRLAAQPLEDLGNEREAILATMRAKTASYTTVGPLALGAALAGRSRAEVDQWASVGEPLGIAFQLRDDVLGVVGTAADTGKPAGDDIREGKRTLIMAHGLAEAGADDRATLVAAVGSADPTVLARAVEVLVRTGAIESVEAEIAAQVVTANERLDAIAMDASHRAALKALFEATATRVA